MPEPSPKAALRRHYLALRDSMDPGDLAARSASVCGHVEALCLARGIRSVAVFWPLGSEVDLRPLMEAQPTWAFHFPRIVYTRPPVLAWGERPLGPGPWGLREPLEAPFQLPPVQLVLAPGLAFAADGHRLGYGRGFYDAMLAALPGDVLTLGAGFSFQRCEALPATPGDVPLQGRVDERGLTLI